MPTECGKNMGWILIFSHLRRPISYAESTYWCKLEYSNNGLTASCQDIPQYLHSIYFHSCNSCIVEVFISLHQTLHLKPLGISITWTTIYELNTIHPYFIFTFVTNAPKSCPSPSKRFTAPYLSYNRLALPKIHRKFTCLLDFHLKQERNFLFSTRLMHYI